MLLSIYVDVVSPLHSTYGRVTKAPRPVWRDGRRCPRLRGRAPSAPHHPRVRNPARHDRPPPS